MCNIWREKDSPFLELEEIQNIFRKNDFSFVRTLTLTGGEPTLREDLPQIFSLAIKKMVNLEHVLLATSGLNTRRTIEYVSTMLEIMTAYEKIYRFDVQVSIDGVKEVHDHIRGINGFFNQVEKTIQGLFGLQGRFPRLNIRFSSVLMPNNIQHADDIRNFASELGISVAYSPVMLSGKYYNNLHGIDFLTYSIDQQQKLAHEFFSGLGKEDQSSLRFYYDDMAKMIEGHSRGRTCMMGYLGFVLEHDGNIYPCVNCEQHPLGNLLEKSFEEIWFNNGNDSVRRSLRKNCCPSCTSLCFPPPINLGEVLEVAYRMKKNPLKRG
jgi:MoaA/NifB/PqqE/SkfB family radical SAM enzyme